MAMRRSNMAEQLNFFYKIKGLKAPTGRHKAQGARLKVNKFGTTCPAPYAVRLVPMSYEL